MFKKIAEFFTGKKPEAAPEVPYKVEATNNAETTFKYEDVKPATVELTPVAYADIAPAAAPKPAAKKKAPAAKKATGAKRPPRKPKSQA